MAKCFKELQKEIINEMKKQVPKLTREYCHKWYQEHEQMKEILSEQNFVDEVTKSVQLTVKNNNPHITLDPFKTGDLEEPKLKVMKSIWDDFGENYKQYIFSKIFG
ncbi:hypothetical protein [[Clostridium] scindens]|uniref:hypothetical protein n=1 Tax=Clostridium scindens (strain JCM 10418 / VPI 12708) TaxID=29347 RepID=UPI001D07A0D8|nr:hypothetical protein [[Clostridium] scindens]MCB6288529.1 hypothetical protein [[Clostridium] scindens]MCB6422516.1 hypothetical protein [[Clostridium] scindens]MCB7194846.1 hypothetical protein [[Clostridium] scindens]MCB7288035.1 hypothetical protein [[Clostridium] scindens]MCG4930581.1 hypothetical protein [[Clostridium] scindens]